MQFFEKFVEGVFQRAMKMTDKVWVIKIMSRLLELYPYYLCHNISEIWDELSSMLDIHIRKNNFFSQKDFCLPVMHKIFATRHWFPEWIDDWSQLGTKECQHSSTSTILCFAPSRYQWLGLICHFGFRCSCKERHEESFLAKRAWAHLYSWDKLKASGTFRNRRTCLSILLSSWGSWHFKDYSNLSED